jgi:hypothetical protein
MKSIKPLKIASSIYSLLVLGMFLPFLGCASVQRPDADICGINFAADKPAHLTCFNIKNDFDNAGVLLPTAKAHQKLIGKPQSLNAGKYMSKEDWPKFQIWLQDMRDYATNHCN